MATIWDWLQIGRLTADATGEGVARTALKSPANEMTLLSALTLHMFAGQRYRSFSVT